MSGSRCVDCAERLPFGRRFLRRDRCETCEAAHAAEHEAERKRRQKAYETAVAEYREVVRHLVPGVDLDRIGQRIEAATKLSPLAPEEIERLNTEALSRLLELMKADGALSPAEDAFLAESVRKLNLRWLPDQVRGYQIAALESGFVLRDPDPPIVTKRGEIPHLHVGAQLLELKVEQEIQWQSAGGDLPVGVSGVAWTPPTLTPQAA